MIDIGRLQYLEQLFDAADTLERFLSENVGDTADYPLNLVADNLEDEQRLVCYLNNFTTKLNVLRKINEKTKVD